jgi:hypothetical protein
MTDSRAGAAAEASVAALYRDLVENIKVTDDISFKLLGAVPLVSGIGSGALSLLEARGALNNLAVVTLSLVGCVLTIGLFRWELRNIQKCNWFISRAARLEKLMFPGGEAQQFKGVASKAHLEAEEMKDIATTPLWGPGPLWEGWGKTQSEKLIYGAAIAAWLVPIVVTLTSLFSRG